MALLADFGCFRPFSGTFILMKQWTIFKFLIKFGLSDLKLVGIGTKFIKIGPEMPILEHFVIHVQKSLFLPQSWQLVFT